MRRSSASVSSRSRSSFGHGREARGDHVSGRDPTGGVALPARGSDDGVYVLSPTPALERRAIEADQPNIISMAFMISYKGTNVALGGDATADESWPDIVSRVALPDVSVLKASHHGRRSGYHQPAVKAMSPWLTITSVGRAEQDATGLYRQYSEHTVSIRDAGDVRIRVDDDGKWYYETPIDQH